MHIFGRFIVVLSLSVVLCQDELPGIDELDIVAYLGQWFQTHASPIVYSTFERNATCFTANYDLLDSQTISVYNTQNLVAPGGEFDDILGEAKLTDETGVLTVSFPTVNNNSNPNYYIMKLGPIVDGLYDYSLVSEPRKLYLFVLARNIDRFYSDYEEEVLQFLDDTGFSAENTPRNGPEQSEHNDQCIYPPPTLITE